MACPLSSSTSLRSSGIESADASRRIPDLVLRNPWRMTERYSEQMALGQRGVFTSIEPAEDLVVRKRGVDRNLQTGYDRDSHSRWRKHRAGHR